MKTLWLSLAALALAPWASSLRAADPAEVNIKLARDRIDFRAGKDLVSSYHMGPNVAKPFFWPVNGPGGVPLTRAWPMEKGQDSQSRDHPHQKSAWFCHGDVIPEGLELHDKIKGVEGVDFWSETKGHGRIVCTKVGQPKVEKNHGQITTHNEWRTADGAKIMDENRIIHLFDFGDARLLVLDIDLEATVAPVTFGDTKEGAMGVRVNDRIRAEKGNGTIENAEGKTGEKECWGRVSAWCDYSGEIDGKTVGLAILDDPGNRYRACWHSRGYGLMAANPFGRGKSGFPDMRSKTDLAKLTKGEHLKLRYGLLLHPGNARDGKIADYFERFVKLGKKPPASAAPERETLLLWPNRAPEALGDREADKPSLIVHLPPADKGTGAAVVICPGGGYGTLALDHEGRQIAEWLNARGVAGFILKYRVAPYRHPVPLQDAQRALRTVRARAHEWQVDPKRVGVWGFSAGGHLASTAGTHFDNGRPDADDPIERMSCRPDFLILCYPVISLCPPYAHIGSRNNLLGKEPDAKLVEELSNDKRVTPETPPTFLMHTDADKGVVPENSVLFYLALRKSGVPAEMHIYEKGPHGVGLAPKDAILSSWPDRLAAWLNVRGLLKKSEH